jgi:hypothetical protein
VLGFIPRSAAPPRPSAKANQALFPEAPRFLRLDEKRHDLLARCAHPFLQPLHEVFDCGGMELVIEFDAQRGDDLCGREVHGDEPVHLADVGIVAGEALDGIFNLWKRGFSEGCPLTSRPPV